MTSGGQGGIVAGLGLTHTPGLGDQLNAAPTPTLIRLLEGFATARRQLADASRM